MFLDVKIWIRLYVDLREQYKIILKKQFITPLNQKW